MKNLIKIICIAILVFSNAICFAEGELAELAELKAEILKPIIDHYSDNDSITRLASLELIRLQSLKGKIKDPADARLLSEQAEQMVRTKIINEFGAARLKEMTDGQMRCAQYKQQVDAGDINSFATSLSISWSYNMVHCGLYARMVMTAFTFNRMNHIALKTPFPFKEAAIVTTSKPISHMFVLVEGDSGAMFAVDPWIREVVLLKKDATKLSSIQSDVLDYPDSKMLTALFGSSNDGGKTVYYDETFVGENTKWVLHRDISKRIEDLVYAYDSGPGKDLNSRLKDKNDKLSMKDIYNYLHTAFPWKVEYDDLPFPSATKSKEAERKKTD